MSTPAPTPAPTPKPPAMPPEVAALITKSVKETVTEEFATRDASAKTAPIPVTSQAKDLQMDPPDGRLYQARAGIAIKAAYLDRAKALGMAKGSAYTRLEAYLVKTKAVGAFASIWGQGGESLPVVESTELIEFLRDESLFLSRPGIRRASGYGGAFVVGRQNTGATVYWVAEGEPPQPTSIKKGLLTLGAHKFAGLAPVSNDLLRRGDSSAAADVGADIQVAAGLFVDDAILNGKGNKQPIGILEDVESAMITASAGTTVDHMLADMDSLPEAVEKKKHKLDESAFYFMSPETFWNLRRKRESGLWVFEGLRDLKNPTHNGFPVLRRNSLSGFNRIGFGLASQLYFGSATEMETVIGEAAGDFTNDMQTLRVIGYADCKLRHTTAFAFKKDVAY